MGLFDRMKSGFGGTGAGGDWAAQAQAAQQMANEHLASIGYTDGSPVTMANSAQLMQQAGADQAVLNAYGQELNRIVAVGIPGSGTITSCVDTGERAGGNAWFQLEIEVTLPGQAPYRAAKRELSSTAANTNYAIGSVHSIKVDPANTQNFVLMD